MAIAIEVRKGPNLYAIALPTIVGSLLMSCVRLASIKAVGALGPEAVAGVLAAERALVCLQCAFGVVLSGTMALVAQHWGAKDPQGASESLKLSLLVALAIGSVLTAATWLFGDAVVAVFGAEAEVATLAVRYLLVMSLFNVAYGVAQAVAFGLRAAGDATTPLWVFAAGNILNITLLLALTPQFRQDPLQGVTGAAWINGAAYAVIACLLLGPWFLGRLIIPFQGRFRLDTAKLKLLLKVGLPASAEQFLFQAGLLIGMAVIGRYGTDALAAYGVGVTIVSFSFVFGIGFSVASSTMVGQHIGAGRPIEARASAWQSCRFAIVCMGILGVVIFVATDLIGQALDLSRGTVEVLRVFLLTQIAVQPLLAIEFALQGALRGAGETRTIMIFSAIGLAVRLSLTFVLLFLGASVTWIFAIMILEYVVKSSLYIRRVRSAGWTRSLV